MRAPEGPTLRGELARKSIHLATAIVPIAWTYDLVSARQVRAALGVAVVIALLVEFARHRSGAFGKHFTAQLGAMLRVHEAHALSGATWLAIGMWGAAMLAPPLAAIAALWAAAVGDASAALVGRSVQQWRAHAQSSSHASAPRGKSIIGSIGAVVATMLGILWLTPASLTIAAALGAVAALAEWPSRPGDDNVRVAFAVAVAAALLGLR